MRAAERSCSTSLILTVCFPDPTSAGMGRYGQSDPHPERTAESFCQDLICLADSLGIDRFYVIGCSGGGPYAWSTLHHLGSRVLGLLTLSGAGPSGAGFFQLSMCWFSSNI